MNAPTHPLIAAGNALAELAREIAADAIAASGDVMDGAHAEALALEWENALDSHQSDKESEIATPWSRRNQYAGQMRNAYVDGCLDAMDSVRDIRDKARYAIRSYSELLDIARTLRSGFGAALAEIEDPELLTAEEEQSLASLDIHIAAANGACARLAHLELEIAGQGALL